MEPMPRLYSCSLCYKTVVICPNCDRGNTYCSKKCSTSARKKLQREASARYQKTKKGMVAHAMRQLRYKLRKKKVTHQGSLNKPSNVLLEAVKNKASSHNYEQDRRFKHCCICHKKISPHFRYDFLSHRWQKKSPLSSSYEKPT